MEFVYLLLVFFNFFCLNLGLEKLYCDNDSNNVLCSQTKSKCEFCFECQRSKLSSSEKAYIVRMHNLLRENVTLGVSKNIPKAFFLKKLSWNESLAEKSQRWAEQCKAIKDPNLELGPSKELMGQNIAVAQVINGEELSVEYLMKTWMAGLNHLTPKLVERYEKSKKGEFDFEPVVQMIWSNSMQIGCGRSIYKPVQCVGSKKRFCFNNNSAVQFVCNYFPAGNKVGESIYNEMKDNNLLCQHQDQEMLCTSINVVEFSGFRNIVLDYPLYMRNIYFKEDKMAKDSSSARNRVHPTLWSTYICYTVIQFLLQFVQLKLIII